MIHFTDLYKNVIAYPYNYLVFVVKLTTSCKSPHSESEDKSMAQYPLTNTSCFPTVIVTYAHSGVQVK